MKITFIGTSHGVPEPNRKCACTLIETAGKKYLIDMGCNAAEELIRLGITPPEITAVFVSHNHCDHTSGLFQFMSLLSWYYKSDATAFYLPSQEFADGIRNAIHMATYELRDSLHVDLVGDGLFYDDGTLRVTGVPTHHCPNSHAFILEAEGKKLAFTADLKGKDGPIVDYPAIVQEPMDLVVCEGAHFPVTLYKDAFLAIPPKKVVFTHYANFNLGNIFDLQKELAGQIPIIMGTDDLVVTV